jgi:hypothetical protein
MHDFRFPSEIWVLCPPEHGTGMGCVGILRSYDLRRSRTVADLQSSDEINTEHVSEAIQYRTFDRTLWV